MPEARSGGIEREPPPGGERPTAVISALSRELKPLVRQVSVDAWRVLGGGRFADARFGDRPLVLGWTGDGRRSAENALRSLLEHRAPGCLIFLGVAGGLSPALGVGELAVAGEVRDAAGPAPAPDPAMTRRGLATAGGVAGMIYTSDRVLATAAAKARLWRALGRPAGAMVDLETAAWGRVAAERGVPYVAVRAVSDGAGDDLPLDFERFRDRQGRMRGSRVALEAARRPSLIGPLNRLRQRVDDCAERLAAWTVSYLS